MKKQQSTRTAEAASATTCNPSAFLQLAEMRGHCKVRIALPSLLHRRVYPVNRVLAEGDRIAVGGFEAEVWAIPAHTAGHIALYFESAKAVFVGDTLFAMGCGRLFEGTAAQMHANLQRLAGLPGDVLVYCGHEYTLANARFAVTIEPDNAELAERLIRVEAARERGEVTLPTTIAEECATNPFMRAGSVEEFARLRRLKDSFG